MRCMLADINSVPLGDCVSVNHGILTLARDSVPSQSATTTTAKLKTVAGLDQSPRAVTTHLESEEYQDNSLSPASQFHRAHRIAALPLAPRPVSPPHRLTSRETAP